jgi:DNA-binding IscR family transcriptional regulator
MRLSKEKKDKISEQILAFLYTKSPQLVFTSHIAVEMARDEEFIKALLTDLKKKGLVIEVNKNAKGEDYLRRARWSLSDQAYGAYKSHQNKV